MRFEWNRVQLGDFCTKIGSGSTPRGGSKVYSDSGEISLIRSQNIYNDGFSEDGLVYIDAEAAEKLKNVTVEDQDILLNITGDSVARVCMVDSRHLPARVNQHVSIIRADNNEFDPYYLYYQLKSPQIQSHLLTLASTGATRNALTKGMIETLEIDKPSLLYQENVSSKLLALEKKIQLNTQINQTLEAMAQAIFKSWFVDFDPVRVKCEVLESGGSIEDAERAAMRVISSKTDEQLNEMVKTQPDEFAELQRAASLFPSKLVDSELGEIPEGWELGQLKDICSYTSEREFVEKLTVGNYISTESMLENKQGITTAAKLPNVKTVPKVGKGDILISNIRPYFKKIWFASFEGGRSADVLGFNSIDQESKEFIYNLLFQDSFFDFMMQTSKGVKMPRGDKEAIMNMEIVIPPHELMIFYSQKTEKLYPQINQLNTQNQTLAELRDTLLPKLLSGELDVGELVQELSV